MAECKQRNLEVKIFETQFFGGIADKSRSNIHYNVLDMFMDAKNNNPEQTETNGTGKFQNFLLMK